MLFGRETVWDEPACLEGDETVSMYEGFKERQVGLGVYKEAWTGSYCNEWGASGCWKSPQ